MSEEVTKQVYQTLLARSRNGRLRKHDTREVANQFGVHIRSVQRLWKRGKIPLAQGIPVNVASRKRGRGGRKAIPVDLEALRNTPLKERMTLEDVSKKLGINKSKLQRYMQQGLLRRHSNSIKPHLTDANKKPRLQWCVTCLNMVACMMIQNLRVYLTMFSLMRSGSFSLKNQRNITCYLMKMTPIVLARARITSLGSCFCVFVLDQGLGIESVFFMGKLVAFH